MTRQSDYKPEYDAQVIEWLAEGKTLVNFAKSIGVNNSTVWRWSKEESSFCNAIKEGRDIAKDVHSEQFLVDNLENQKLNNVVTVLYCRNVLGIKTKDDSNLEDLTKALNSLTITRKIIDDKPE
jgi:hypothetical protein